MASFDINPKTHKAANKQAKINNMKKSDNPNERKVADKKLTPSARVDVPKFKKGQQEEVVPGLSLVDVILGEEKCGKGMYYCYTDKKCKKLPEGLKMTARFGGGGIEPQEVGIDKPVEGGEGGNGGNGGGTSESLSIEDAFGNKFMEVVDLIKPEDIVEKKRLMNKLDKISGQLKKASALHKKQSKEVDKVSHHLCAKEVKHEEFGYGETIFGEHAIPDENGFVSHYNVQFEHGIVENVPVEDMEVLTEGSHENHEMTGDAISEKCWKGYKKKGMKTMFGKRYPNCVKANEENETVDEGIRGDDSPTNAQITKQGAERQNAVAKLMQNKEMQKRFDAAIDKKIKKEKEEQAKRMRGEEVSVDEGALKDRARRAVQNQRDGYHGDDDALTKEMDKTKKSVAKLKNSNVVTRYSADAAAKKLEKSIKKEEVNVDEAVRLQAEYGNLLAVVVVWRGRSLMIKMFFPQATMPKREDVQREVQKVYPGCKVTQFRRTELPSETSPHNDPILRVQKEEAECAGTPKGKDCPVHGQKCCPNLSEEEVDEAAGEKDACYHKVKARYSVWPSAYASGALVKCRKKGAKNWGNKTKKEEFEYELNEGWVANTAAKAFVEEGLNEEGVAILIEEMGLESFVEFVYDLGESTMLSEARAGGVRVEPVTKGGKAVGSLKGGPKAAAIKRLRKEKQARRDAESGSSKPSGMKAALKSQSDRAKAVKSAKSQQPKKRGLLDKVAKTVLDGMDRHNKAMKKAKGDIETTKKVAKKAGKAAKSFGSGFVSGVKTAGKAAKAGYKMATEEEDRLGKSDLDEATPRPKATQRGKISKAEAQRRQARADRKAAAQERRDDRAKAGIDALIGSDEDRKAAAAARANPQSQRQKALKRTIADRMAKGVKDNKLGEKLNLKKADMGEVIDDFYDSDAPQFKGKSKEKRRQMAIAAKLQANEEVKNCGCGKNPCMTYGESKESKKGKRRKQNEAVDLKKKSSERKLNTNPGEKPESAKEYRKNSEPLRKHREKFGDLAKEEKEGDHEFEMARRQLSTMKNAAKKLEKKMGKKGEGNLKAWVQSKITKAADYADTAADYVTKEDWQSVNRKDKTDGLSQKAVNAYRKENPGSKLKTAVTKKPSELKKGSKDAKRRSSFCSRMKGMKKRLTSAKTARDPDSRINKALRRWNCN